MKKILAGVLTVILTITAATPVYAEDGAAGIQSELWLTCLPEHVQGAPLLYTEEEPLTEEEMAEAEEEEALLGAGMDDAPQVSGIADEPLLMQYLCGEVRSALLSGLKTISLAGLGLKTDEVRQFRSINYYCPYTDGTNIKLRLSYTPSTGEYSKITITNYLDEEATASWVETIDMELARLDAATRGNGLGVDEQAVLLHDYMAAHYHYDMALEHYYPSIMLTEKDGVCQSYAYLFQYIMNVRGIECYTAGSDEMDHAWNILAVNGNYYHVDVTWDDPAYDYYGQASHNYLLLSDATVMDAAHEHSGWDITELTCTDTSYENMYFVAADSPVAFLGNDRYYIDDISLHEYDIETGNDRVIDKLGRWKVWNSYYSYQNGYSGLFSYNRSIYYNTATEIRCYEPVTDTISTYAAVDTSNGYCYGLIEEDGAAYYSIDTEPGRRVSEKTIAAFILPDLIPDVTLTPDEPEDPCREGHAYGDAYLVITPSCGSEGLSRQECQVCGAYLDAVIPGLTHSWDRGSVTKEATEEEEGIRTFTCRICQGTYEESIAKVKGAPTVTIQAEAGSKANAITLTGRMEDYANADSYAAVVEHGIVYMTSNALGGGRLTLNSPGRKKVTFSAFRSDGSYSYTLTAKNGNERYSACAYVIYRDRSGVNKTVYSETQVVSYNRLR